MSKAHDDQRCTLFAAFDERVLGKVTASPLSSCVVAHFGPVRRIFERRARVMPAVARSLILVGASMIAAACAEACARESDHAAAEIAPAESLVADAQLRVARATHQAITLQDGRILVVGGCGGDSCATTHASAELYDAERHAFSLTGAMAERRASLSAVRLDDGRVLVVGGWTGSATAASAELYLPTRGVFVPAGTLSEPRMHPQSTLLLNGNVLISGGEVRTGQAIRAVDIYNPRTATFVASHLLQPRASHTATRLQDGRVLIVGGHSRRGAILRSAEIFDPATGKSTPTGSLAVARYKHAAVALPDGRVLVIAGMGTDTSAAGRHATTEIFDPATGAFSAGPALHAARYKLPDAAVVTGQGHVIVAGGAPRPELWRAGDKRFEVLRSGFERAYDFSTANLLADGSVLIIGGYDDDIRATRHSWRLSWRGAPAQLRRATP